MNVVIAGGSGFLGRALKARLLQRGDSVRILTRRPDAPDHVAWTPTDQKGTWVDVVATADAVVNLAGEPIEAVRWTDARKKALTDSRIESTRGIVTALQRIQREGVLLNASAVGYYGNRGSEVLTEASPPGDDFLARLCQQWEREAIKAASVRRVIRLRTGLVLDARHGALAKLLPPFRLGLGGPMGSGSQYWSWIHVDDWVRLAIFAMDERRIEGPLNLAAPRPVTNAQFAKALGRTLHRPAVLPAPGFALKLLLGEMAEAMVLSGQRIGVNRAAELGFTFSFPALPEALDELLQRA